MRLTDNIKALLVLLCLVLCPAARGQEPVSAAQQLLQRLSALATHGIMYGHQDDPFYGITWQWDADRSDTKELVGDYPAVMGFDLGGIELAAACNLDSVPFDRMRQEILAHHRRGGIITLSWHPRNPLLGTTAWIESDTIAYNASVAALRAQGQEALVATVVDPRGTCRSVLPGGAQYDTFQQWLARVTAFLVSLTDDAGEPIPLIFRPWHENNGSWFWWGAGLCSAEEYLSLWALTQDYIRSALPASIVWAYSPNLQGDWTAAAWMERYPGDDRVDLLGIDAYQWGTEEAFVAQLSADLAVVSALAAEHHKLLALTECGYQNSPDATWWTRVFRPIIEQYPVVYFLPWRNWHAEHFGASPAAATADDFRAWAADGLLLLNDIKDIR